MKLRAHLRSPLRNEAPAARSRRRSLLTALAALALPAWATNAADAAKATRAAKAEPPLVEVWKSPSCGCCGEWVKHLEANGLRVKTFEVDDASKVRRRVGFADKYGSCHTALVGGYALEGHVPAREIKRLLEEKPQGVIGIAVPGMPLGSPGMDGPIYNGRKTPYDVVLVKRDGTASVYQSYR